MKSEKYNFSIVFIFALVVLTALSFTQLTTQTYSYKVEVKGALGQSGISGSVSSIELESLVSGTMPAITGGSKSDKTIKS